MKKTIFTFLLVAFLSIPAVAHASEGEATLTNKIGTQATCWMGSVFMQDLNYHIIGTCRNLTYPGGAEIVNYVLWGNPEASGTAFRIGELGLGKFEYRTQNAFTSVFVTVERDRNVRTPSGQLIMQGTVKPFSILEGKTRATSAPEAGTKADEVLESPTPTPAAQASGIAKFLTGGIIAFLGLFAVIFILFIITRR